MNSLKRLLSYASAFRADIVIATTYSVLNKVFDIIPEVLIGVARRHCRKSKAIISCASWY
jgi:ATP-binding cassette subfamily B protein